MASKKKYAEPDNYEAKLNRVMERLGVSEYNYNWDRHGGWVQFQYKNELYRFDHSVDNAKAHGINLTYGTDAFAQIVRALEGLALMVERGIYDLQVWIAGMKFLPPPVVVPECFRALGFTEIPTDFNQINTRFRTLAKEKHPDYGGSEEEFIRLKQAAEEAVKRIQEGKP
jgi:hypothetical protein